MINFIICDDNEELVESISEIVDKEMMKNKMEYKKHIFYDYNMDFLEMVRSKISFKVYILDIEMPSASGIDMARIIREKDLDSVIIFLTSHTELGYTILKNEFLFLSFICKFDNYKSNLKRSIRKSLDILGKKQIFRFEERGVIYKIPLNDILYITRDTIERKCLIYTDYNVFSINKTIAEFLNELGDAFRQSHRSCIINTNRVMVINYAKKKIIFDNGKEIDLLSAYYRKSVVEKC